MPGDDPVCLHRAAYWNAVGTLDLDLEQEPPASAAPVACWACSAAGTIYARLCPPCDGAGVAPLVAHVAALRTATTRDRCGGPLDTFGSTNDALQPLCGTCVEAA